jgi:hypothetical protein
MGGSFVQLTPPSAENLACPGHRAALLAFELITIRWKIGEWKEGGYALRECEGVVYYIRTYAPSKAIAMLGE